MANVKSQKKSDKALKNETKTLFTWSGGPWSSGVGFFCFRALVGGLSNTHK